MVDPPPDRRVGARPQHNDPVDDPGTPPDPAPVAAPADDAEPTGTAPGGPGAPVVPKAPLVQRILIGVLLLVGVGGIVATVRLATTGNDDTSSNAPDFVERLVPTSGSEVLTQSGIGIDVATGYDGYLILNGVEIRTPEDGLSRDVGSGRIEFTPGEGKVVTELLTGRNCVLAIVWRQSEGPGQSEPVSWCFDAT